LRLQLGLLSIYIKLKEFMVAKEVFVNYLTLLGGGRIAKRRGGGFLRSKISRILTDNHT
jgi:hypothetical protein